MCLDRVSNSNLCVQLGQPMHCMTKPQHTNHNQFPKRVKFDHNSPAARYI